MTVTAKKRCTYENEKKTQPVKNSDRFDKMKSRADGTDRLAVIAESYFHRIVA